MLLHTGATASVDGVTVRRKIEACAEELFDAWLDAERLASWMRPAGANESVVSVDAREGGRFEIVMHTDDKATPHRGTYIVIDRPRRLVFTWNSPMTGGRDATVSVHFRAEGEKTEVAVIYQPPPAMLWM